MQQLDLFALQEKIIRANPKATDDEQILILAKLDEAIRAIGKEGNYQVILLF